MTGTRSSASGYARTPRCAPSTGHGRSGARSPRRPAAGRCPNSRGRGPCWPAAAAIGYAGIPATIARRAESLVPLLADIAGWNARQSPPQSPPSRSSGSAPRRRSRGDSACRGGLPLRVVQLVPAGRVGFLVDAQIAAGLGARAVDAGGRAVESWKRRQRSRGEDRSPARFTCAAALHPHEIARSAPVRVGSSRVKSGSQPDLTTSWKSGRLFALQSAGTSSRQIGWRRGRGMSTSRARLEQDDHCSGRLQPTDLPTWPDLTPYSLVAIQVAV